MTTQNTESKSAQADFAANGPPGAVSTAGIAPASRPYSQLMPLTVTKTDANER